MSIINTTPTQEIICQATGEILEFRGWLTYCPVCGVYLENEPNDNHEIGDVLN